MAERLLIDEIQSLYLSGMKPIDIATKYAMDVDDVLYILGFFEEAM